MSGRAWMLGIVALVVVCATVLGAMQVVPGERVLELLGVVVAAFFGSASANMLRPSTKIESLPPMAAGRVELKDIPPPPGWKGPWPPEQPTEPKTDGA